MLFCNKIKLIFLIVISFCHYANSSELTHLQIISSAKKHYPQILSYYEIVDAKKGSALASMGFFDVRLKQNYYDKSRGFYDGKTTDTIVEKELGFLGSKIYGGYRKSFGDFADYDGAQLTNNGGEYRVGAKFSLLRDSMIDQNRLSVILANLGVKEAQIQLETIEKEIVRDATKSYWQWISAAKVFYIYDDLYQLAIKRQAQFEERLKKGDVAQIIVVENNKNILRRKTARIEALQDFEKAAINLSLFWRSENGKPIIPNQNQVPEIVFNLNELKKENIEKDIEIALENRPEGRILKIKKEENLKQLEYSKNLFKPNLDVDVGASKDLGGISNTRSQANNYVGLNFSVPLQMREAKGKSQEYSTKLQAIKYDQQLFAEKISAQLSQIAIQANAIIEMYSNLSQEAKLADLLENSEREKFKHGASNFFLVNMREQDTAASKAAVVKIFEKYQATIADYKMAVFVN